ncbi:MAG: hypothetical protein AB7J32_09795 [Pseudonocardia sp.]
MRISVEAWDPSYGAASEVGELADSRAETTVDVELPAARWRALDPDRAVGPPRTVLFVDGVRRVDAQAWVAEGPDDASPALCGSWAAGAVCCCAGRAHLNTFRVERGLFTTAADATDVVTAAGTYRAHVLARGEGTSQRPSAAVEAGLQAALRQTEVEVAQQARAGGACAGDDDLLVLDGSVQGRQHLPRTIGFAKTHSQGFLPQPLGRLVATLTAHQRTPVFRIDTPWRRHTWYLRLPGPVHTPWAGIVRVECSADLATDAVVELAARSQATLPRFASVEYKDGRAPQNLYPVAGLERELRRRLGLAPLAYRALRRAAHATSGGVDVESALTQAGG